MARISAITTVFIGFLAAVLCAVVQVQGIYGLVQPSEILSNADIVSCAFLQAGLNLGTDGRIIVNCSDLTQDSAFDACMSALDNVTDEQIAAFPGALMTIDLVSTSTSPGLAALEVGRLIATNATSRVGLSFSGLDATDPAGNIGAIADTIATARSYLTADTPAPVFVVRIEGGANPCAGSGALVPGTGEADLATAITNAATGLGMLENNNVVTALIGFSGLTQSEFGTDVCGFAAGAVAVERGDAISETGLSGPCSGITNASAVYGPFQLSVPTNGVGLQSALQNGTARVSQALGVSVGVGAGVLSAANVTALVGCLASPGFTPAAGSSGTLSFRGVGCGPGWNASYATQCRAVVTAAVGDGSGTPVLVMVRFDFSTSAAVGLDEQVAFAGRVVAGLAVGGVNVVPENVSGTSAANLGLLDRVYTYLAGIHRPAVSTTRVNVMTSIAASACGTGGMFAETTIGGTATSVSSECAAQTEFVCAYASYPNAFAPTDGTCGFDAAASGAALYGYSSPSTGVFNSSSCVEAGAESSVVLGYASGSSVPTPRKFSVGPTMLSVPAASANAELVGCKAAAGAGYLSVVCGSVQDGSAMTDCTAAISGAVSANSAIAVLAQVIVPADASSGDVASAVRALAGTSGVVGIQYVFEFGPGATDATSNIDRIVGVLNASVVRVNAVNGATLTQIVVLGDATPCTESGTPGSGYLFEADGSASLFGRLSGIEQSSVFLYVSGAVNIPASDVRCGFDGVRVSFGLPVLPEYSSACNSALTASGVSLVSIDPQTFDPAAVTPGEDPADGGGDGVGSLVRAGVWSVGAVLVVLLSLVA